MAKEATRDRFRIYAETSSEAMGPLLATLTRLGLENIGYELITDVPRFNKNGPRKVYETSTEDFVKAFLEENATFRAIDLVNYFEKDGRSRNAAYPTITKMVASDLIKKIGQGVYQRADVKALAAPIEAEKKPHALTGKAPPKFEMSGADVIWRHIRNRQKFGTKELAVLFRALGRNHHSVSPIITKMVQKKQVKPLGDGEYAVLKKAVPAKKAKPTASAKKPAMSAASSPNHSMNGHTAPEETANG